MEWIVAFERVKALHPVMGDVGRKHQALSMSASKTSTSKSSSLCQTCHTSSSNCPSPTNHCFCLDAMATDSSLLVLLLYFL
jgi:hypothetical protein